MNLLLIGLRGSGKTTVGRLVAARLGWGFVDLDDVTLTYFAEKTIAEVWRRHGEAEFRLAELGALAKTLKADGQVVALGGGTPTAPGADEVIRRAKRGGAGRAFVVYLRADEAALRTRLRATSGSGTNRPSLTGGDPVEEIPAVLAARDPLYRRLADAIVETGGLSVERAVEEVIGLVPKE